MSLPRALLLLLLVLPVLAVPVPATAGAGDAGTPAVRYWSYFWGQPSGAGWQYAPTGADHEVADGDVLGWRYVTAATQEPSEPLGSRPPRASASFVSTCPTPAPTGMVRVALVLDHGDLADAPAQQRPPAGVAAQCVVLPASPTPTGADVVATVASLDRSPVGLVCAIGGYPVGECAPTVLRPPPPAGVEVSAGSEALRVSWRSGSGTPAAGRSTEVVLSPGGEGCLAGPGETACTVRRLRNGVRYQVAVLSQDEDARSVARTRHARPRAVAEVALRVRARGPVATVRVDGSRAAGVRVRLLRERRAGWVTQARRQTGSNGTAALARAVPEGQRWRAVVPTSRWLAGDRVSAVRG